MPKLKLTTEKQWENRRHKAERAIRALRKLWRDEALATRLGVCLQTIRRWGAGAATPPARQLERLEELVARPVKKAVRAA